jgi:hypothetical protein
VGGHANRRTGYHLYLGPKAGSADPWLEEGDDDVDDGAGEHDHDREVDGERDDGRQVEAAFTGGVRAFSST